MPVITPASSRLFAASARLAPVPGRAALRPRTPPLDLGGTDPQALVVGASLIAAADGVPAASRLSPTPAGSKTSPST